MKNRFDFISIFYNFFMHFWGLYKDKEILNILNLKGNEKIIDIGGGTCYISEKILPFCSEVTVLDESEKMLSQNKNSLIKKIVCDATNITLSSNSFDVVILSDIVHHIFDKKKLFNECNRILKKGGKIVINDFSPKDIRTEFLKIFERIFFGKIEYLTKDKMTEIIENENFKYVDSFEKDYFYIILGKKL